MTLRSLPASTSSLLPLATSATSLCAPSTCCARADRIACEDTRQTQKLLNHFGIETPTISCHEHNERARATELIAGHQSREGHCRCLRRGHAGHQRPRRLACGGSHRRRRAGDSHPRRQRRAQRPHCFRSGLPLSFTSSDFCRRRPARAARVSKHLPPSRANRRARSSFTKLRIGFSTRSPTSKQSGDLRSALLQPRTHQDPRRVPARHSRRCAARTCFARSHPRRICAAGRSACSNTLDAQGLVWDHLGKTHVIASRACNPKPASTRKKRSNVLLANWANPNPSSTANSSANAHGCARFSSTAKFYLCRTDQAKSRSAAIYAQGFGRRIQ